MRQTFFSLWAAHPGQPRAPEAPTASRSCGVVGGALTSRPAGAPPTRPATCPSPFSGQAAATTQRGGGRCQGRVSAERSEGSLDSRSPPHRYTLIPPGRAGVFLAAWAPLGADGSAGAARRLHQTRLLVAAARARGRRVGGRGPELPSWAPARPAGGGRTASAPAADAARATHQAVRSSASAAAAGNAPQAYIRRDAWRRPRQRRRHDDCSTHVGAYAPDGSLRPP
jgi:hypothetical protein